MGIVLMPIRIRIRLFILMPIQIRIRILHQVLHMLENQEIFYTFFYSSANLHCFIFLVSVLGVIILCISDSLLQFSGKSTLKFSFTVSWKNEMDKVTDPAPDLDRRALDADPDPAKWCRSVWIWIHNTDKNAVVCINFFSMKRKVELILRQPASVSSRPMGQLPTLRRKSLPNIGTAWSYQWAIRYNWSNNYKWQELPMRQHNTVGHPIEPREGWLLAIQ